METTFESKNSACTEVHETNVAASFFEGSA
jgi:hypothetical protein